MECCALRGQQVKQGTGSVSYTHLFEKVLLGPQKSLAQAALGSLMRRVTGENIPLMKVTMNGPSETFYAVNAQHVVIYKLEPGETISVESENLLAFTQDCKYSVRSVSYTHLDVYKRQSS